MKGKKPAPANRYTSKMIMKMAGQLGFTNVSQSRHLSGYAHKTPGKVYGTNGKREVARRLAFIEKHGHLA